MHHRVACELFILSTYSNILLAMHVSVCKTFLILSEATDIERLCLNFVLQLNYQFMKKCVQDGPVTPMADDWWDTILTMIPAKLVLSAALQPHIKELYDEVKGEYEASIRKAMGESKNENKNKNKNKYLNVCKCVFSK